MSKPPPIFIHSLFRTGSTYIFNVFRRSPEACFCYQDQPPDLRITRSGRVLLRERWHDSGLKARIKAELGQRMIPAYGASPRAVCNRQLTSADNGFTFFTYCARYIGAEPLIQECPGDMFVAINEEKKGLGRLRLILEKGARATVDIMNFPANEKREIGQCELLTGANLVDFHHALLKLDGHDLEIYDNSAWYRNLDRASNFYYPMLLHFVAHAVLFENYPDDDESREAFYTHRQPLDPKLIEQDFPAPYRLETFHEVARALGFKRVVLRGLRISNDFLCMGLSLHLEVQTASVVVRELHNDFCLEIHEKAALRRPISFLGYPTCSMPNGPTD